ncbi:predicted GPI-anchored protein 1 [[Candida] jaroonii]|uniref:Predicted GPI-anchored protein 1 n=1 Tax=[Candida] jaroonii TaxID=467808 RepID=A0ACA9Y771_9ASCO|nr:predicted GPI-anchored protein 1 [[Candida] jaroonii]
MRLLGVFYIFTLILGIQALADQGDGKTTSKSATTIWVTITTDGAPVVVQTTYSQSFDQAYTEADTETVKSGTVGLGSASGSVGGIRSYDKTTISNTNGAGKLGGIGLLSIMLGMLV